MRIKDGCEISISGRNKKRILLVGVILSLVTLLTPVSLAATAGMSVSKIIDQSVNNVEKEPTKDTLPNVPQVGSSNDVTNNYITNSGLDSSNNILINIINKIELNSGSVGPESGNSNNINQVNLIGGTESKPSSVPGGFRIPEDLQVGDILIWDAGYSYDHGFWKFLPDDLSGHNAPYTGDYHKDINGNIMKGKGNPDDGDTYLGNVVEAVPKGVSFNTINGSNYHGEVFFAVGRVKGANDSQKQDAVDWAIARVGCEYQKYWIPGVGARKSYDDPNIMAGFEGKLLQAWQEMKNFRDKQWYCSEFVWAAYYNACEIVDDDEVQSNAIAPEDTIDIDNDSWDVNTGHPIFDTLLWASVSPVEIYEDNNVTIVYELREYQSNSCTFTSLSVDSDSNSNSNTASSNSNTVSYSDSKDNTLNYGSKSNTISYTSSSLNANTLVSKILKIPRSH